MYTFKLEWYLNNGPCILAYQDGELLGKLSSWLPDVNLSDIEFAAKLYGENRFWAKEALKSPYFIETGDVVIAGYVTFPIYELDLSFIKDQFEATYNKASDIYLAPQYLWDLYDKYVSKS